MGFTAFERAFLMFSDQADKFRARQWSGWKHFLNDFIRGESVRTAWQLSKETYDTDFQLFMDKKIAQIAPKPVAQAAVALPPNRIPADIPAASTPNLAVTDHLVTSTQ